MGRTGKAYRKIRSNFTDKPTFFSWVREGRLSASGRPYSKQQVEWLKTNGIAAILTLAEEPLPKDWTEGLETRHISLEDHAPVAAKEMIAGADYIASAFSEGKVVHVHCLAGKGRTGSILAAYLMIYEGKTAREAVDELRATRPGSVEHQQEANVLEFEREAIKARSRVPARGTTPRKRP